MCVSWYRCLKPGDIISLRRYRVKQHYQAEPDDIGTHKLIPLSYGELPSTGREVTPLLILDFLHFVVFYCCCFVCLFVLGGGVVSLI